MNQKDDEYREYGVEWTIDENPIKKTRPVGYIYICQKCGRRFEYHREIHVPWCADCRLNDLFEKQGKFKE
jgi:DNA-directed RNA polymerase subunit RPC12/RpoP